MPTIATFQGIVIFMYWAEHGLPHLHAMRGDDQAVFLIESGDIIGGELPRRHAKLVRKWIALRRDELLENWRRGRNGLPFVRIPGPPNE